MGEHQGLHPAVHDGELIKRSLTKPDAFESVFNRHYPAVLRFCVGRVGYSEAPDVAADTFLRAFDRRHRFDVDQATSLPWLFGIAANVSRERIRKLSRGVRAVSRLGPPPMVSPFEAEAVERIDAGTRSQDLASALSKLTPDEYAVLALAALADFSYQDIADSLDVPIGTVRSRLARAKRRMRELLATDRPIEVADHARSSQTPKPR